MNNFSYTSTAIQAISAYKNQYGLIANFALRIQEENPDWALLNCVAVAHDRTIVAATDHKFNGGDTPVAPPIAFLDFIQVVMNKVCGLARHDLRGKRTEDFGNGIDFSQDLTNQLGFSVDQEKIAELVDEDFFTLNNVHSYISQGMPYLDNIDALRYHAESVKLEDGTWIKALIADSFDEAITIINEKGVAFAEQQAELRQGESSSIDFGAKPKDTKDAPRTKARLAKSSAEFEKVKTTRNTNKVKLEKQVDQMATRVARKANVSKAQVKAKLGKLVDQAATA
jgi:hypothetical protein